MSDLILSVENARVSFGNKTLFTDLTFHILEGDKICLVGKNGAGKSTLMNIITGARELDDGKRWQLQGLTIGYLKQEVTPTPGQSVHDYVFAGLKPENQDESHAYKVDIAIEKMELNGGDPMSVLSGGQLRRADLARALVEEPDILLLDEPTNHLDLDAIEWLENELKAFRGAVLCVSHDRAFLNNISDKVFWLDRGKLKVCPRGYRHFDDWAEMVLEQEERELNNREKLVEQEVAWASRGVKARRKRNVRRLALMKEMRDQLQKDRSAFNRMMAKIEVTPLESELSSKIVAEFYGVTKKFHEGTEERTILDKFSLRILRGDRIGILGRNGTGKTSFLKLLVGDLAPDAGKVKRARNVEFSYFDQRRKDLVPGDSLWKTLVPSGGDYIDVMGKTRHVCGYLKDFLFDPSEALQPVATLSGGQKNRLLLAKVLANPKNFLILDEPTNDLDMDTLDMLEEILVNYHGTLIIVSHDRDFLDNTVTKILAFEGEGKVEGYIGGYSDYLEAQQKQTEGDVEAPGKAKLKPVSATAPVPKKKSVFTYPMQHELKQLPGKIEKLTAEVKELATKLADPDLYQKDRTLFEETLVRHGKRAADLHALEERWLELEELKSQAEVG